MLKKFIFVAALFIGVALLFHSPSGFMTGCVIGGILTSIGGSILKEWGIGWLEKEALRKKAEAHKLAALERADKLEAARQAAAQAQETAPGAQQAPVTVAPPPETAPVVQPRIVAHRVNPGKQTISPLNIHTPANDGSHAAITAQAQDSLEWPDIVPLMDETGMHPMPQH